MGLIFLSFVAVQYNDPDPLIWMGIYGIAALLCFLSAANKVPPSVLWLAAILFAIGGVYMWPERYEGISIGGGDIKNIEEARESLGLFMGTVVFSTLALFKRIGSSRVTR
ncbi:transmembrane 220 family protein [Pontibacter korlensis]